MGRKLVWCGVLTALVFGLFSAAGASPDAGTATFFLAHEDTHAEATSGNPLVMNGTNPVTFELRVRDAGSAAKAGWQATLLIDACAFETPPESALTLGDMFSNVIPVRKVSLLQNNTIQIILGQLQLTGEITTDAGELASVTLTPKASPSCAPDDSGLLQIRFAGAPMTQWLAPNAVVLPLHTQPGYARWGATAVTLSHFAATAEGHPWPGMVAAILAVVLGGASCIRLLAHRRGSVGR